MVLLIHATRLWLNYITETVPPSQESEAMPYKMAGEDKDAVIAPSGMQSPCNHCIPLSVKC